MVLLIGEDDNNKTEYIVESFSVFLNNEKRIKIVFNCINDNKIVCDLSIDATWHKIEEIEEFVYLRFVDSVKEGRPIEISKGTCMDMWIDISDKSISKKFTGSFEVLTK